MSSYSRSVWAVVLALVIIFIGLFLVCAQRRGTVAGGDDMASNDEQFRQELLQLLDLTDDGSGQDSDQATTQLANEDDTADAATLALSDDEMLALLGGETESGNESASGNQAAAGQNVLETKPTTTTSTMGLTPEMFAKMRGDINRLESDLERRSATVDSLQSIISNRNARLQDLETRQSSRKAAAAATQTARKPARSSSSAGSSAFNAAYEEARNKFESRQYQAAIDIFQRLLADYPENRMADNCQYWIGECYFGMKEYQKAVVEFQKVFAYSENDKHDDAQLMIGLSYVRSGQKDLAQKEFESFLNSFAGSEYASVAKRYYRNI